MSQELHYTSVPRGLQPGSKGFCTVAMSANLAGPLRERLEGLSGYQQVFPPHDPNVGLNPVVHAHHRLNLAGRPYSLISRVAFAGLDYTDRSNKYAHHVVLDPSERPAAGPAWLLSRPGFMDESWRGEPRMIPTGRSVPQGDAHLGLATAWKAATGDAGWAGALAESFLADPSRPAYLIYEPGLDPLPLFAEALALLPAARRWDVDFNTYFTQAPQGLTCAWRGVLAGSPQAKQALKTPGCLVLDLSKPMPECGDGPLIRQARTGERPAALEPLRETIGLDGQRPWQDEAPAYQDQPATLRLAPAPDSASPFDLSPAPPPLRPRTANRHERTPSHRRSRFQVARWWVAGASALVISLGGLYLIFGLGGSSDLEAILAKANEAVQEKKAQATVETRPEAPAPAPQPPAPPEAAPGAIAEAPKPQDPAPAQAPPPAAPPAPDAVKAPEAAKPVPEFLIYEPRFIELPKPPAKANIGEVGTTDPVSLELESTISDIKLHLLNDKLKLTPDGPPGTKAWKISPNDDDAAAERSIAYTAFDIARLRLDGKKLTFSWDEKSARLNTEFPKLAEILPDCVLELETADGQTKGKTFLVLRSLTPIKGPIELSRPGKRIEEVSELVEPWANGETLNAAKWDLRVRSYRIDVTDDKQGVQVLSEEQKLSKDESSEFAIVPRAVYLDPKPHGGDLTITLKTRALRETDREEWADIPKRIENNRAEIKKLQTPPKDQKPVDEDEQEEIDKLNRKQIQKLQKSIDADEKRQKELEPKIQTYNLIDHNKSSRLSLIIGIHLNNDTFLDLARIGSFAK